ncbi:unnamed protein product [Lathyrus oleraceus]|nr:uncharacterized protein LOC127129291 [Pisum sativum]
MEEYYYKRSHVPAFGSWDWNDDHSNFPYTKCFDSARQPGSLSYSYSESEDRDLYGTGDFYDNHVVSPTRILVPRKRAKMRDEHEKETKKKNLVNNVHIEQNLTALPTSKPIDDDDDLYNISPHLRYAKVKKRRRLCFFSSCFLPACNA